MPVYHGTSCSGQASNHASDQGCACDSYQRERVETWWDHGGKCDWEVSEDIWEFGSWALHCWPWSPCTDCHPPTQVPGSRHWNVTTAFHRVSSSPESHHDRDLLLAIPTVSCLDTGSGYEAHPPLAATRVPVQFCLGISVGSFVQVALGPWGGPAFLFSLHLPRLSSDSLLSQPRGQVLRDCLKHPSNTGNLLIISSGHLIYVGKHGLPLAPRHQETVNEADPPQIGITAIWHVMPAGHQAFPTHHVISLWGSTWGRPHVLCVPDEGIRKLKGFAQILKS